MPGGTALTIGNFDGVHKGHVALVAAARAAVGEAGRVVVLAFDPHPLTALRPERAPPRLSRFEQRRLWLRAAGADELVRLVPDAHRLGQTAEDFLAELAREHRPVLIVEGPDFRFGRGRGGDVRTLEAAGAEHGFDVRIIEPVEAALADEHVVRVSSSMARWLLERGRVDDAAALLGRPYELQGPVVAGDRRGREIGVPTANLGADDLLLPADGIYAARATGPDGTWFPAAVSVGTKPTFGAHPRTCEAHLIGYDGPVDDYGWTVTIRFTHWLRDQITFAGVEALVDQLRRDLDHAAAMLRGAPGTAVVASQP